MNDILQVNYSTFQNVFGKSTVYYRALDANNGSFQLFTVVFSRFITCLVNVQADVTDFVSNHISGSSQALSFDDVGLLSILSGSLNLSGSSSTVGVTQVTDGNNVLGTSGHPLVVTVISGSTNIAGTVTVQGLTGGEAVSVSGTLVANQGTAGTVAGSWPVELTDGNNVLGTSAHPLVTTMISGSISVVNASVGTTGSATPGSATNIGGIDGNGQFHGIAVSASGSLSSLVDPGVVFILRNTTVSGSGQSGPIATPFGASMLTAIANVSGSITSGSVIFTLQEIDPGDLVTVINSTATSALASGPTLRTLALPTTRSPFCNVKWTVSGSSAVVNNVYLTVTQKLASSDFAPVSATGLSAARISVSDDSGQVRIVGGSIGGGLGIAGRDTGPQWNTLYADTNGALAVGGYVFAGSSFTGKPAVIAGVDASLNGNVRALLTNTVGNLLVTASLPSEGPASPGTTASKSSLMGGQFNLTPPSGSSGQQMALQTNQDGGLYIDVEGRRSTYSATITKLVPGSGPNDVFIISGSASTTVRVNRVEVSMVQTTGPFVGTYSVMLLRRSTQTTGGTFVNPAKIPHDPSDPAATAGIVAWSTNPTSLGTLLGPIRSAKLYLTSSNASPSTQPAVNFSPNLSWDFGTRNNKPIILRSVNDALALNLSGTTVTGGSLDISVEWSEE